MKSNIKDAALRLYSVSQFPTIWKDEEGRTIHGYQNRTDLHYTDGWRDYLAPVYDPATHRIGELVYDKEKDVVTREVIKLTAEELEQNRKAQIPYSITPTQGRVLLAQMPGSVEGDSLLHDVLARLPDSKTEPIAIYWEYAMSWDRDSQFVAQMAAALGMTETDVDEFFIAASQISD